MYEPAERVERQQGHEAATVPTKPVPSLIRRISTDFGLRHVRGVAVTRLLVTVWLVILGSFFCVLGHWYWLGALLFAPAALNGWLAYQMPRWKPALDAEKDAQLTQ
jgi:hypothetical protein